MKMRVALSTIAALAVAGCQGAPVATDNASGGPLVNRVEGDRVTKAVLALNERQRDATFIRAILDAGLQCETVRKSERLPDQGGQPVWRADCGENNSHIITIAPDGSVVVNSRAD
jgi:hypothetical protein